MRPMLALVPATALLLAGAVTGALAGGCRAAGPAPAAPPPAPPPAPAPAPPPAPAPAAVAPPPQPAAVGLAREEVAQGEFTVLTVHRPPPGLEVSAGGLEPPRWFREGEDAHAILAAPPAAAPGPRTVEVTWPGGAWAGTLTVRARAFAEDRVTVSQQMYQESVQDPRVEAEGRHLRELRARQGARERLWAGPFAWPVTAPETTDYGEIRYVNGQRMGQHHGLDLGAPAGTPVGATNRGRVLLARPLAITGNTVLVDHGGQLFSLYAHLESLAVREGDWVQTGQMIGRVGSTGLSTGPHLHWALYVGNTPVNPKSLAGRRLLEPPPGRSPD